MAVSNYIRDCDYTLDRLEKVVWLFDEGTIKLNRFDDGAMTSIALEPPYPTGFTVNSISIEDTSGFDERYSFSHRLTFRMNGYANENFIGKRYYAVVKTLDGRYFLLNPMVPCRVQYTFTLGYDECYTEFVMDTVSNHPTFPLNNNSLPITQSCETFFNDGFKSLELNLSKLVRRVSDNEVDYAYDRFSSVDVGKDAVFTEAYDGNEVKHTITFSLPMKGPSHYWGAHNYDIWHYLLLEYGNTYYHGIYYEDEYNKGNRYCALIKTKMGNTFGCGFVNGLQPSFKLTDDTSSYGSRVITLEETSNDSMRSHSNLQDAIIRIDNDTSWVYTDPYGSYYECVGDGKAMYLLQKQVDAFGNDTGIYKVKEGYRDYFPEIQSYRIRGTFTDEVLFDKVECATFNGETGGTLPSSIGLPYTGGCKSYTFSASCDWYITTQFEDDITVNPMSGYAGEMYTISVCSVITRWITSGYTCDGYDKYTLEVQQRSIDGGTTWTNTTNTRRGSLIETDSEDCGYVPPVSCVVNSISCSPTAATITTAVTSVTTTVNISATGDGCGRRWRATVEDDSVPSGSVTIIGENGDSLSVKQEQTVTIKSLDDDSKTTTFQVSSGSSAGYLIFKSVSNSTYSFSNAVQYSLDSGSTWTSLSANASTPTVSAGDTIYWKASITPSTVGGVGTFSSTGTFEAYGNALSLSNNTFSAYQFRNLFSGCTGLTSAQNLDLPTSVTPYCYSSMFTNCTSLTGTPTLPAYTLENWCYHSMFADCTSLVSAPSLPATALAAQCYEGMFRGCSSLRNAPSLSVTTLAYSCYKSMFQDCTSLTSAPALPATTLTDSCYMAMFLGCTSLTTAPTLSSSTLVNQCYMQMFQSSAVNNVTCLATDISAHDCTYWWLYAASSTGTFTKKSTMSGWSRDASGIPANWTVNDAH